MATYTAIDALSLNMNWDLSSFWTGANGSASSTLVVVDVGDGFYEHLTGTGFTYDSLGRLAGGTITGISEHEIYQGTDYQNAALTGVSISASQFMSWAQAASTAADSTARAAANDAALQVIFGGDDTLTGSAGADYLTGLGGNNYIAGGAGADTLIGGAGNDHLYGQSANGGSDGADSITAGDGSDYLQGNAGNDTLHGGNGSDRINGGANDDSVYGEAGNDTVNGNLGNDTISGGDGYDSLRGGQGNDSISGDAGDDLISGDKGVDVLTGGAGNDIFRFASGDAAIVSGTTDTITDFLDGSDHISLAFKPAAVLTGTAQTTLADAQIAAQTLLDGHAGNNEVAAIQVGSDTYLFFGGSGGATVDSAVLLQGVSPSVISTADFL